MSETAIKVDNLSKRYRIGLKEEMHDSLLNAMAFWLKSPISNFKRLRNLTKFTGVDDAEDIIWALKDVSFKIKRGNVVGIIGRNGAGKTTLLRVLSKITEPTTGYIEIDGRVASLLAVGTGFNPELTGRENIYMNGTLLGMTKKEVDKKLDEIVAFSGVEQFIDTPVKRYSSGMLVRLGFSVAAHLEPEILLIDEILAVGDAEFQRKCLGKMEDVSKSQGRTILFVSHNMAAVRNLCPRSILLEDGKIIEYSITEKVIEQYLKKDTLEDSVAEADVIESRMRKTSPRLMSKNPYVRLREVRVLDKNGKGRRTFFSDEEILFSIVFDCLRPVQDLRVELQFYDENYSQLMATQSVDDSEVFMKYNKMAPGTYEAFCYLPANMFGSRLFFLTVGLHVPRLERITVDSILDFEVKFKGYNNVQKKNMEKACFRPQLKWDIQPLTGQESHKSFQKP